MPRASIVPRERGAARGREERRCREHAANLERAAQQLFGGAHPLADEQLLSLARLATLQIAGSGQQLRGHGYGLRVRVRDDVEPSGGVR